MESIENYLRIISCFALLSMLPLLLLCWRYDSCEIAEYDEARRKAFVKTSKRIWTLLMINVSIIVVLQTFYIIISGIRIISQN